MAICCTSLVRDEQMESHLQQLPARMRRQEGWSDIMKNVRSALAKNLKFLREQKGWTQPEAAAQYGVTLNQVVKYENGKNAPDVERLAKIALLYGVSTDAMLGIKKLLVSSED